MKFNEESFKKALSECKIIRWQNHFKNVVKAYLKAENEQYTIPNVVGQSEQLNAFVDWWHNLSQEELAWYEGRYVEVFLSL